MQQTLANIVLTIKFKESDPEIKAHISIIHGFFVVILEFALTYLAQESTIKDLYEPDKCAGHPPNCYSDARKTSIS